MRNWIRACRLDVLGGSGESKGVSGGGPTDLRIRFNVVSHTLQSPNLAEVILTNPSRSTVALVQGEFTKIRLSAGYQDGGEPGQIFSGSVTQSQFGEREGGFTDTLLRIWASDSDLGYNNATVRKTLAAGSTPQDIVDTCMEALAPYGVTMGQVVGVDLSQPSFPRAYVLAGMARDLLREVTTSKNANYTITDGKLDIIGKNATMSGSEVELSAGTGMIGQPIQTLAGIIVRCLINPAIRVNGNVKISASSIVQTKFSKNITQTNDADQQQLLDMQNVTAGTYRILHIEMDGDTRGNPWFQTLTCIGKGGSVNSFQAGLGYS